MIATDDPHRSGKGGPSFFRYLSKISFPAGQDVGKPNVSREGNALCPSGIKQQLLANSYVTQTKTYDGVGDG